MNRISYPVESRNSVRYSGRPDFPLVLPLITGHRSVSQKGWIESMKTFGISTEDGKRIIYRLGTSLLSEHEKLIGIY